VGTARPSHFKVNEVSPRYVLELPLAEPSRHARRLINFSDNDRSASAIPSGEEGPLFTRSGGNGSGGTR